MLPSVARPKILKSEDVPHGPVGDRGLGQAPAGSFSASGRDCPDRDCPGHAMDRYIRGVLHLRDLLFEHPPLVQRNPTMVYRMTRTVTWLQRWQWLALVGVFSGSCVIPVATVAGADAWSTHRTAGVDTVEIHLHGKPFATYHYRDQKTPRPFFANLFGSSGVKVSRNHPPGPDDLQDHDTYHPGIWLAFGDLSGADSWRLKAPVEHVRFVEEPREHHGALQFVVANRYLKEDRATEVCRETCRYRLFELPHGVLIDWDSSFQSKDSKIVFGDQEELGLGVRLATPINVKSNKGGRILNSNGEINEKGLDGKPGVWGKQADWCDYSGTVGNEFVGMMLMPHPNNHRRSWAHARDYGFVALNPFGINAFTKAPKNETVVPAGTPFRLRYGVLVHWHGQSSDFDPASEYQKCLALQNASPR